MPSRPALVRFAAIQVALAAAVGAGLWLSFPAWRLGQVTDRIRKQYPDVPQIATADLATWLASPKTVKPVILDVRSRDEYDVSHLIEAHRVDPAAELNPDDLPDDHGRAIIVYCSTGERSAPFARRLQRAGYVRVFALEGAIVRWANEGRPLTDGRELVTRVHPGDAQTGRLLKDSHRAAVPVPP